MKPAAKHIRHSVSQILSLCALFASIPLLAVAQKPRSLDETVAQYAAAHNFNGTVLVEDHGTEVYENSFGVAERSFGTPTSNDTAYRIASVTKLFTSVVVLQLIQEGKVGYSAPLNAGCPTLAPVFGARVGDHGSPVLTDLLFPAFADNLALPAHNEYGRTTPTDTPRKDSHNHLPLSILQTTRMESIFCSDALRVTRSR